MSSSWTKKNWERKKENGWAEKKREQKNEREKPNPAEVKINRNERNHVRLKGIFIYSISRIYYFRTRSLRLCPWNNGILHLKQFNVLENICVRVFIHTLTQQNTYIYVRWKAIERTILWLTAKWLAIKQQKSINMDGSKICFKYFSITSNVLMNPFFHPHSKKNLQSKHTFLSVAKHLIKIKSTFPRIKKQQPKKSHIKICTINSFEPYFLVVYHSAELSEFLFIHLYLTSTT